MIWLYCLQICKCIDRGEIWHGRVDLRSTIPCQILPSSVQRVAPVALGGGGEKPQNRLSLSNQNSDAVRNVTGNDRRWDCTLSRSRAEFRCRSLLSRGCFRLSSCHTDVAGWCSRSSSTRSETHTCLDGLSWCLRGLFPPARSVVLSPWTPTFSDRRESSNPNSIRRKHLIQCTKVAQWRNR